MARDVDINVIAHDRTAGATKSAERNFERLNRKVKDTEKSGSKFGTVMKAGFGKSLAGLPMVLAGAITSAGVAGVAAAAAIAPLIGATLIAGILLGLGGGILVAGIIGAMRDPGVKAAASDLGKTVKDTFRKSTESFIGPVKQSFTLIDGFLKGNANNIKSLFDTIAPAVVPLTRGFLQLAQNALPGIKTALQAAMPFLLQLAEKMPALGTAVGKFFQIIAANGPTAGKLFGQIIDIVIKLIPVIAQIIVWIMKFYSTMLSVWTAIIGVVRTGVSNFLASFNAFKASASAIWNSVWSTIRAIVMGGVNAVRAVVSAGVSAVMGAINRIRAIVGIVSSAFNAARSAAASRISALIGVVRSIPGRVRGAVGSLGGILVGAGRSLVQGLINGINAMLGRVRAAASAVRNAASSVIGSIFAGGDGGFQMAFASGPALMAGGGGTHRTEPPRQTTTVENKVYLGNELLDARIRTVIRDELDTRAHRASVGRR